MLVNNAGIYLIAPLAETTVEDWNRLMAVNVTGTFLGMKHTAPQMATAGGGAISNLSSIAGLVGVAGHTLYGASKGAVRTMSKDVAAEYAAAGVRVNSLHPTDHRGPRPGPVPARADRRARRRRELPGVPRLRRGRLPRGSEYNLDGGGSTLLSVG